MKSYHLLPQISPEFIDAQDYFLLFESCQFDEENFKSYILSGPVDIIVAHDPAAVKQAFDKLQRHSKSRFCAGYLSYELGYVFESGIFSSYRKKKLPLLHLGVFDNAITFDHRSAKLSHKAPRGIFDKCGQPRDFQVSRLRFNLTEPQYLKKVARIKTYIKQGECYQVNLTGNYSFGFSGCAYAFYNELKKRQGVRYAAFCKLKNEYIISLSPELFFKKRGIRICSHPMKGTIERGRDSLEDTRKSLQLQKSLKGQAENLMIVDLMRNDLGRICEKGSVKVKDLFSVEKYNTLFQMISQVTGSLRGGCTYFDIFKNIFPGGSVTGAPKIRTMQIIRELEARPRGVYCGALGVISPNGDATFNMPIRTITLRGRHGQMGVGSGIVIDSDPKAEFEECKLKAKFLTQRHCEFSLLETLLWDKSFKFLNEHIKRMQSSASYFDFCTFAAINRFPQDADSGLAAPRPRGSASASLLAASSMSLLGTPGFSPGRLHFDAGYIKAELRKVEKGFERNKAYRVRVLLDKFGRVTIEHSVFVPQALNNQRVIAVSRLRTDRSNKFLYHKTTSRAIYDSEYQCYVRKGYYDVIFCNNENEVTESAIANVVIQKNGRYYTPSISCGLLGGIYRAHLLKQGKTKERILTIADLRKADKIFLCNSVRGMVEVKISA